MSVQAGIAAGAADYEPCSAGGPLSIGADMGWGGGQFRHLLGTRGQGGTVPVRLACGDEGIRAYYASGGAGFRLARLHPWCGFWSALRLSRPRAVRAAERSPL